MENFKFCEYGDAVGIPSSHRFFCGYGMVIGIEIQSHGSPEKYIFFSTISILVVLAVSEIIKI